MFIAVVVVLWRIDVVVWRLVCLLFAGLGFVSLEFGGFVLCVCVWCGLVCALIVLIAYFFVGWCLFGLCLC